MDHAGKGGHKPIRVKFSKTPMDVRIGRHKTKESKTATSGSRDKSVSVPGSGTGNDVSSRTPKSSDVRKPQNSTGSDVSSRTPESSDVSSRTPKSSDVRKPKNSTGSDVSSITPESSDVSSKTPENGSGSRRDNDYSYKLQPQRLLPRIKAELGLPSASSSDNDTSGKVSAASSHSDSWTKDTTEKEKEASQYLGSADNNDNIILSTMDRADGGPDRECRCHFRLSAIRQFLLSGGDLTSRPLTDMKVTVGDRSFRAHRLLLASYSAYFRDLYHNAKLFPQCIIPLDQVPAAEFAVLLDWITTDRLFLTPDNVEALLTTSQTLGVDTLPNLCREFKEAFAVLEERRDPTPLYSFAVTNGMEWLKELLAAAVVERFQVLESSGSHLNYSFRQLLDMLEAASGGDVPAVCAYRVARDWLLKEWRQRERHVARVLDRVQFRRMAPQELRQLLLESSTFVPFYAIPLLTRSLLYFLEDHDGLAAEVQTPETSYRVHNSSELHEQTGNANRVTANSPDVVVDSVKFRPPNNIQMPTSGGIMSFGGTTSDISEDDLSNTGSTVYFLDLATDAKWTPTGRLPLPRVEAAACLMSSDGAVYVSGGRDPTSGTMNPASDVWRLDTGSGEWTVAPRLLEGRRRHGLVCIGRRLYAVGGMGVDREVLNSIESYSPDLGDEGWRTKTPLPVGRFSAGVAAHCHAVWVCGGVRPAGDGRQRALTARVDVYVPEKNSWIPHKPLPVPRGYCDAVSLSLHHLVVSGGMVRHRDGIIRIPPTMLLLQAGDSEWLPLADMRVARYKASTIYFDPYLVVLGGAKIRYGPALKTVECYDTEDDKWVAIPQLPVSLTGACFVGLH